MERITLPSGGWAELRDPENTSEAQRRPLTRLSMRLGFNQRLRQFLAASASGEATTLDGMDDFTDADLDLLFNVNDALVVALVAEWSFEQPITVEGLRDIPSKGDYDGLQKACAPHLTALMPNFGATPDPASPTPPSND